MPVFSGRKEVPVPLVIAPVISKDKIVIDFSPFKKDNLSFIAHKTSTYKNVRINDISIQKKLAENTQTEQVTISATAREKEKQYWNDQRHEALSDNEQKVYRMMDTIKTIPAFIQYTDMLKFIFDGHLKYGQIELGPWYKWLSGNQHERFRLRFDLGTTEAFSKYLRLHSYLAYGFKDAKLKGRIDLTYRFPNDRGITILSSYTHDLDNGRSRYNDEDITTDNLFSQLIRRPGIPQKFLGIDEIKLAVTKEWKNKFSVQPFFIHSAYETFNPLPPTNTLWSRLAQNHIVNSELGIKLRYAPGEKTFVRHRKDFKIKTGLPVIEFRSAWAIQNLFKSDYQFLRLGLTVSQTTRIPRWGKLTYMVNAGKIITSGPLPFMLLEIHPGNEIYYYNSQSFNLMNRFEYMSDRYIRLNIEHNLEKKFLNLIPFLRKSTMRQFWNFKAVIGNLSDKSRAINRIEYYNEYKLRSLRGGFYIEMGTGIENIFKILRIDLVWRSAPLRKIPRGYNPQLFKSNVHDFGIFASVRFQL